MNVVVSGASGLVGRALTASLDAGGHRVARLVRRPARTGDEIEWDPARGQLIAGSLQGYQAVVHLAGESVAGGRWTAARKRRIHDSRVDGTRLIAETLAVSDSMPRILVNASAIGFYGNRGDEEIDEDSPAGTGFLADTCRAWEAATRPAASAGARVALLRIGIVLAHDGGALEKMLPVMRVGLGGPIGDGRQYMSWIQLEDVVGAVEHALFTELEGPLNATAPTPETNADFTRALGRILGRPTVLPFPGFAARLLMGEMGRELLLAGARVLPRRLLDSGYRFRFDSLEAALRHTLRPV